MPVTTRRLAVAGVAAAAAIAVPAAALATNNPSSKAPSTPAQTAIAATSAKSKAPSGGPELSDVAARLASRLGVSTSAAEHALRQLNGNVSDARFAVVAHELGVTPAQLNAALIAVKESFAPSGGDAKPSNAHQKGAPHGRSLTSQPGAAAALASHLGVSLSAAQRAMHQIGVLAARNGGGIDSNSPQLAAIAHQLGVSRPQLNNALRSVKESFAR